VSHSRQNHVRIKKAHRGLEALGLREAGLTYRAIGEKMGISEERAWELVTEEFDRLNAERTEKAEAVIRLELERLDKIHQTLWARCQEGDLKAIATLLKTMERRAALLGLDIQRHEVKVEERYALDVTARIVEYAAELDRQLGARQRTLPGSAAGDGGGQPVDQAGADLQAEPDAGL
jgi:hypothetical protein